MRSPSYFAALPITLYYYYHKYSKVHVVGFLQHFELEGHRIAKLIAVHELKGTVVPYIALKEVAHGMVC